MTQTLEIDARPSRFASAPAVSAPTAPAKTDTKAGVFAITYGIAFALLYTAFERLNWPLFTYHPVSGVVDFGRQMAGVGPPMFWYGWLVLSAAAALVVALAATAAPVRWLQRATVFCCAL